jgi:hypothetical protein
MSTTLSSPHVAGLVGSLLVHVAAVFVGFVPGRCRLRASAPVR